jgi:hypothetical protein
MIVEKQMECRLVGETEVLRENLPQRHFCPSQNPTWLDPGLNAGRRIGKPGTNRLIYAAIQRELKRGDRGILSVRSRYQKTSSNILRTLYLCYIDIIICGCLPLLYVLIFSDFQGSPSKILQVFLVSYM